jgi:hypothetical protein
VHFTPFLTSASDDLDSPVVPSSRPTFLYNPSPAQTTAIVHVLPVFDRRDIFISAILFTPTRIKTNTKNTQHSSLFYKIETHFRNIFYAQISTIHRLLAEFICCHFQLADAGALSAMMFCPKLFFRRHLVNGGYCYGVL